jgi:cell wall-associated NlpC family hydrolase
MGKRKTVGGLAIAGIAVWLLTDKKAEKELAALPAPTVTEQPPVAPEPAVPAAFATRRPSWRRRTATTLAFTALFFAGAALSAGAGNVVAHIDDGSTDAAAVDVAPADDTATTDTTGTDTTTDATTTDATTTDVTTTDAATTDVTTTDDTVTTDEAVTTDSAPAPAPETVAADPSDAAPSSAPAAPAAPAPVAAAPAPAAAAPAAPLRKVDHPVTHVSVVPANGPTVAPAASPFPVIAFDPQAWLVDHPGTPTGDAAVAIAERYVGVPYVWGGNQPSSGFDCSGLTQFVYAQLGVWLPHYAAAQFLAYPRLDPSQLAPGDLVFFEPKADGPGHVAIYAGNGTIIEAPQSESPAHSCAEREAGAPLPTAPASHPSTGGRLSAGPR